MATVITKTIGPTGDYLVLQDWMDACPTDLVAVNQIWRGQLQAGEHVYTSIALSVNGSRVTDANCYVELMCAPGASFLDHANIATNPLRYDPTKGAAIKQTGTSGAAISIQVPYTRISGIQVLVTASTSSAGGAITYSGTAVANVDINNCILESAGRALSAGTLSMRGSGSKVRNTVVIQRSTSLTAVIASFAYGASAYNSTFISLGAVVTNGITSQYTVGTFKNIYVGGAATPHDGGSAMTITNCHSDVARAGWTVTPLSTATFENITDGTHDFRLKTGSGLVDTGATETLNGGVDIYGTTRPQGAGYDVGAWELPITAAPPAAVIGWTESNDTHGVVVDVEISGAAMSIGWAESSDTHGIAATVDTASGTLTTRVIKNNNGIPRANLAGVIINIYSATTGALVLRQTGLTTNAEGRLVVLNAALAKGVSYAYEIDLTVAGMGRRLPVGTTV